MVLEWIRNIIRSCNSGRNRPLPDAEQKVQQSIEKLSTPDCHSNKRSKRRKILKIKPIEYRPTPWRNPSLRRNCTSNSSSSDSIDISPDVKENVEEKTKNVASPKTSYKSKISSQQMLTKTKNTRSPTKSSSPKEEILDVNIPMIKIPKIISNTFPKISPSRKIQNLNIVLPPGPKIELSKDIEDVCNDDYNGEDNKETSVLKEQLFNVNRTTQTENLIKVDVIIENRRENGQKNLSFRGSQAVTTALNTSYVKRKLFTHRAKYTQKFSPAHLFSSVIIEEAPKAKILSPSILEKSLIFENKSMNVSNKSENIRRLKKISPNLLERTFIFEKSSTHNSFQDSSNSIDLELPLRSMQLNRKNNIVREIVRDIDGKMKKSLHPRHSHNNKESFVKQIVNALEKGNISGIRNLSSRSSINDEDSPSESETRSYVTSCSPKDTDYSDYSRRSPTLNSDYDQSLNFEHLKQDTLKVEEKKKKGAEDDTVHWISIPRCTVPRSSSPFNMNSISPSRNQTPCISPIKNHNEVEYSLQTSWGAIYNTSNPLCKKLFREAVVMDSGYSG